MSIYDASKNPYESVVLALFRGRVWKGKPFVSLPVRRAGFEPANPYGTRP